jgi:hypothetical protein
MIHDSKKRVVTMK